MTFQEFVSTYQKEPITEFPNSVAKNPVISICVQTYQHKNFISECLDGILAQKVDCDYEILLGEDESTDGTREICIDYAKKHPDKIRLFLHKRENQIKVLGQPSSNFNALYNLYNSKGKYVAFCEGDDVWADPLKLQKQFEFLEMNSNYSICYHDYDVINHKGEIIDSDKRNGLFQDFSAEELMKPWIHPATLTIFYRNMHSEIPLEMAEIMNLDIFLYSILGHYGSGKYLTNIEPAHYRVHDKGMWSNANLLLKIRYKVHAYSHMATYYYKKEEFSIASTFKKRALKYNRYLLFLYCKRFEVIHAAKQTKVILKNLKDLKFLKKLNLF